MLKMRKKIVNVLKYDNQISRSGDTVWVTD